MSQTIFHLHTSLYFFLSVLVFAGLFPLAFFVWLVTHAAQKLQGLTHSFRVSQSDLIKRLLPARL